jgi:hypothetical protein
MVVALDLERDGEPVTEVDHPSVLAGPLEHVVPGRGQALQQEGRVLVAAVLGPEQREDRQLEVIRLPAEQLADTVELPVGQTEGTV